MLLSVLRGKWLLVWPSGSGTWLNENQTLLAACLGTLIRHCHPKTTFLLQKLYNFYSTSLFTSLYLLPLT